MIKDAIRKLYAFQDITAEEAAASMNEIMEGDASNAQIGAFLTGLRMKGETIEEIMGCARVMREKAEQVDLPRESLDIVGTGGDGANTFNISTCSAFVVAAADVPVAKHGNRSVSSQCGSADVLENLGGNISLSPDQAVACFSQTGICFMFAPVYHKSMKHAAGPRKELGQRTIFNLLGPLANPARASYQLLGVCDEKMVEPLARVLLGLGIKNAMAVCSHDKLDEISISAPTTVCEVRDGRVSGYIIHPGQFGLELAQLSQVVGGDAEENAAIIREILAGAQGPKRDIVLLNSGAALYIAGKARTMREGIVLAAEAIDSGAAAAKLEAYRRVSQSFTEEKS